MQASEAATFHCAARRSERYRGQAALSLCDVWSSRCVLDKGEHQGRPALERRQSDTLVPELCNGRRAYATCK
ncbi:hypothetical protein L1887_47122 [Cichorium endivia]|nr:hypothetical protein L1887_47122 [Cichorium endivia]